MDMTDKVVKLIEDSHEDADLYKQLLEAAGRIKIEYVPARPGVDDYADLAADPETGAVMIDERLGEFAGVDYTGLQVADFLRTLRPELPIYILTNYANEIADDQGQSVEFIIDKKTVRKAAKVYVARILRAMQQYEAALMKQQRRLKELIDRKLAGELNEEEETELRQLRAAIERPFAPGEIEHERRWDEELRQQKELLEQLEQIARGIQRDITNSEEEVVVKPEEVTELKGFASSAGVVVGKARVLKLLEEIVTLEPGEIMVVGNTNPAWAPVFSKIKAAVTDIGGITSHAAIVCREYGLPAVTGTGMATSVIKTGDIVKVDGDGGVVTIVKRAGS